MGIFDTPRQVSAPATFPERQAPVVQDGSVLGAAFRTENIVGAAISAPERGVGLSPLEYEDRFGVAADPDFNAWDLIEGGEYEEYADTLATTRSRQEYDGVVKSIDRERVDREILQRPGGMAASMLAGVVDVPSLIPGVAFVRGAGVMVNALRVAAVAGAEATGTELALRQMQELRTAQESQFAIGGSIILGGLLGGAAGALARKSYPGPTQRGSDYLDGGEMPFGEVADDLDGALRRIELESINAARANAPKTEDFELFTRSAQKVVDLTPSGVTFGTSFIKAKSPVAQKIGLQAVETPFAVKGVDDLDLGQAVETQVKVEVDGFSVDIGDAFKRGYSEYRKGNSINAVNAAFNRVGEGNLTQREWGEELSKALRRGDKSTVPGVDEVAARIRREVIEPLKKRAIKSGLLPEDVEVSTAESYFPRMWDSQKIVARSAEFKERLASVFERDHLKAGADRVDAKQYAELDADAVYKTLTQQEGLPPGMEIAVGARGPLKERTLNVRDVDFEDFLNNDAELVLNRYARVMSADVALTNKFGRADMQDQIREINQSYTDLIEAAPTEKARLDLDAERVRIVERVEAVRDLMRGTYRMGVRSGVPYRVVQGAMTFNYIRALGGLVLSALPDAYRPVMAHGAKAVWGGAVKPLITNLKQYRSIAKQNTALAGIAEVALNNRMLAYMDVTDPMTRVTPTEALLSKAASVASAANLSTLWNQFFKEVAVMTTTNRLRNLGGSKADRALASRLKLSARDIQSIQGQMKKHGVDAGGVFDPRVSEWDEATREMFAAVLRADADTVIVTPGIGDKVPVVEGHEWLKPAMQFKNFAVAAHSRVTVAGLQEDQARFLSSMAGMSGVGMFVYWLKAIQSGREPADDVGTWIAEGIDRSGTLPLVMEVNNWAESFGAPGVYYALSMGESEASRYAVRSTAGKLLGPTAGLINDLASTLRTGFGEAKELAFGAESDVTAGDIGSMRRLVPFGRHPGVKEYLDLWLVPNLKEAVE